MAVNCRMPGNQSSSEMAAFKIGSKQTAAVPEIVICTKEPRKTPTHGHLCVSEEIDCNHLEAKLNVSSSSETSLGNVEDDCFVQFRKTSSAKIEKIETWMKSIQESLSEMKFDLLCSEKVGKTVNHLEAEIQHLKRTSPLTISDDKERGRTIQSRALRLEAIKAELISIMEYFERLEKRYDNQCIEIAKTVAAFPNEK